MGIDPQEKVSDRIGTNRKLIAAIARFAHLKITVEPSPTNIKPAQFLIGSATYSFTLQFLFSGAVLMA